MDNIDNKIVVFSQETAPIIAEIIKKYNLDETPQEASEIIKNGKFFRAGIVLNITEKVILDSNLKKDLSSMLQQELNISGEIASNIAKDIEKQLLPIAKIASLEETGEAEKKIAETTEKEKQITAMPIRLIKENQETNIFKKNASEPETFKKTPKKLPEKINKTIQPHRTDTYREPIE